METFVLHTLKIYLMLYISFGGLVFKANHHNPQTTSPWRTCLMVLLCTALGGVWTLEQPSGSVLEYYPCWRECIASIFACGGDRAVQSLVLKEVMACFKTHVWKVSGKAIDWDNILSTAFEILRCTLCAGGWPIISHLRRKGIGRMGIHQSLNDWTLEDLWVGSHHLVTKLLLLNTMKIGKGKKDTKGRIVCVGQRSLNCIQTPLFKLFGKCCKKYGPFKH